MVLAMGRSGYWKRRYFFVLPNGFFSTPMKKNEQLNTYICCLHFRLTWLLVYNLALFWLKWLVWKMQLLVTCAVHNVVVKYTLNQKRTGIFQSCCKPNRKKPYTWPTHDCCSRFAHTIGRGCVPALVFEMVPWCKALSGLVCNRSWTLFRDHPILQTRLIFLMSLMPALSSSDRNYCCTTVTAYSAGHKTCLWYSWTLI